MARKPNIFRTVEIATALADGMSPTEISIEFSQKWRLSRAAIHAQMKTLLKTWASMESGERTSLSPGSKTQLTIDRMQQLRADLSTGEARGEIVRRYAALWAVQPAQVDRLIRCVLDEDQHELIAQSEAQRLRYLQRIHAHFARYADVQDWDGTALALERLLLVSKKS